MTGYGSGDSVNKGIKILVELSSVNRKQVEVAVSVPNELESLEPTIRKSILESGPGSAEVGVRRSPRQRLQMVALEPKMRPETERGRENSPAALNGS